MMDWTDRFCRYFLRLITHRALLYTEMIHANAIIKGNVQQLLDYHPSEHPVAIQLGGSEPKMLAQAAKIAADYGYDEINLNVGCPSERVQSGSFGACLMAEPELVAECIAAMKAVVAIPVTVKTRIGIDRQDRYEFIQQFIDKVASAGCQTFIIHARSAWLKGLSPKENREIPPLKYAYVYRIKQAFPQLNISINGGIKTLLQAKQHLQQVDGVMIGRQAYQNPYCLATVDRDFYADTHPILTRRQVIQQLLPYIGQQLQQGVRLNQITRHILGLFQGQAGARAWRRYLSEHANRHDADASVVERGLAQIN